MKRTTITLPNKLRDRADRLAKKRGISLGELIRKCLAYELDWAAERAKDPFWSDRAVWKGPAPPDGALNHDRYIYDEEP